MPSFFTPMAGWLMSSWVIKAFVINAERDLSTCRRIDSGRTLDVTSGSGSCRTPFSGVGLGDSGGDGRVSISNINYR